MTDTRDPERKLLRDVVRYKRERNAARELATRLRADYVAALVKGRLLRLEDFYTFIGIDMVTAPDGSVDAGELDNRLTDLLLRRPELAASGADVGPTR
ncbi:hypothetical protein [Clavibacter michiganensis]|uniref:hypothetical protein n=1 Tax=Clavibacter michiganensis TaxID=28447 RepID=UPI0026DBB928|nr:hypothetical protein [Clavibacter michiganensis]MDO4044426.1 hypothetical protein [Clavibacter michiganensis]MDO4054544.1 hypothetical protein [Clavibacter michiganensis]MDO4057195.1 hypothetical protein [Clavibacter michiganensis]MDO4066032.1 hypothetical protein [Clavibacter michiganensis]MDO4069781.1 hypothetical protein [Clavibacter michiganensis]